MSRQWCVQLSRDLFLQQRTWISLNQRQLVLVLRSRSVFPEPDPPIQVDKWYHFTPLHPPWKWNVLILIQLSSSWFWEIIRFVFYVFKEQDSGKGHVPNMIILPKKVVFGLQQKLPKISKMAWDLGIFQNRWSGELSDIKSKSSGEGPFLWQKNSPKSSELFTLGDHFLLILLPCDKVKQQVVIFEAVPFSP